MASETPRTARPPTAAMLPMTDQRWVEQDLDRCSRTHLNQCLPQESKSLGCPSEQQGSLTGMIFLMMGQLMASTREVSLGNLMMIRQSAQPAAFQDSIQ